MSQARGRYYDTLNCSPESTLEQIATEFRHRSLELHPDKHPERRDEYLALIEAYDTLGDAKKRALYDRWLASGIEQDFNLWRQTSSTVLVLFFDS